MSKHTNMAYFTANEHDGKTYYLSLETFFLKKIFFGNFPYIFLTIFVGRNNSKL
jgi:hypothetical protein